MPPLLFRVDDVVEIRDTDSPVLAIVIEMRADQVRIAYRDTNGCPVRRWILPSALLQRTAQYAVKGIPTELQALRARRPS